MTIVAYDGKKMIADSLGSVGDLKLPGGVKKIYEPEADEYWEINGTKVIAFGMSGLLAGAPYVRELLQKGITHRTVISPSHDQFFEALCILETGDAYVLSTEPHRAKGPGAHEFIMLPVSVPIAIGSGAPYALAIMSAKDGNQAEKGVAAAKRLCAHCGGDNVVWHLPPPPEVKSVRPVLTVSELLAKGDDHPINNFNVGMLREVVGEIVHGIVNRADKPAELTPEGNKA